MTPCAEIDSGPADVIQTPHFGQIGWDRTAELFLPGGLPGFEDERRMIPVEIPAHRPLVFLQSIERPDVCFVSLPVRTVLPGYELHLTEDDRAALGLDETRDPEIGTDVLCLALLLPHGGSVEVNLDAPIVINLHNSRCVQSISPSTLSGYYRLNHGGAWEAAC
ncbi:MAG TPA: flagellar assembly protein FliW [Bryobacteraceae bacterium]|nr:flagellar assembly protein FliW [Bryobacteraceae bacterium]